MVERPKDKPLASTSQENFIAKTLANKAGLYIVDPERDGAASGKPYDAAVNESQKSHIPASIWKSMLPELKKVAIQR